MKYNKMKSGGMYDAIMKYMEGGNMRMLAEGGKPDYLDLDDDGNKEELMREAAKQMREGGRVYKFGGKMYEHGGSHGNEPDLTFIDKPDPDVPGATITQFLVEGRPVTGSEAISYYSSNMGPKEGFEEWYANTRRNSPRAKSQKTEMIKNQITSPGYKPGMTFSSGQSRERRAKYDTRQQQGGNEGIEGKIREDRIRKILSGLADYNQ